MAVSRCLGCLLLAVMDDPGKLFNLTLLWTTDIPRGQNGTVYENKSLPGELGKPPRNKASRAAILPKRKMERNIACSADGLYIPGVGCLVGVGREGEREEDLEGGGEGSLRRDAGMSVEVKDKSG